MNLFFRRAISNEILFLVFIDEVARDWVEITLLPEELGSLGPQNFIIEHHLLVIVFEVAVRDHVVVSLRRHLHSLATNTILLGRFWALAWRLEVMLLHVNVANNVVVHNGVLTGTEVPGLLLRVVRAIFQTLQLVVKVEDVVGLLVAQLFILKTIQVVVTIMMKFKTYLVLGQGLDHVLMFKVTNLLLTRLVRESLCDRVVLNLLSLDVRSCHFVVCLLLILKYLLRLTVALNILAPSFVVVTNAHLRAGHVGSGHLCHCNYS